MSVPDAMPPVAAVGGGGEASSASPSALASQGEASGSGMGQGPGACVVCTSGFARGARVLELACGHSCHEECMVGSACPTCRQPAAGAVLRVVVGEDGEDEGAGRTGGEGSGRGELSSSSSASQSASSYVQSLLGARFGRGPRRAKESEEEKERKRAERAAIQRDIVARREREMRIRKELGLEEEEEGEGEGQADRFGLVRVPERVVGTLGHVEGDGSSKVAIQAYMSHEKLKGDEESRESLLELVKQRMAAEEEAERSRAARALADEQAYQRELAEERERAKAAAEQAALDKTRAEKAAALAERRRALGEEDKKEEHEEEEEERDPLEQIAMGRLYLKQRRAAEQAAIDSHRDLHRSGPFAPLPKADELPPSRHKSGEHLRPDDGDASRPTGDADGSAEGNIEGAGEAEGEGEDDDEPEPEDVYDMWQRGELDEDDPWEAMGMVENEIPYL